MKQKAIWSADECTENMTGLLNLFAATSAEIKGKDGM